MLCDKIPKAFATRAKILIALGQDEEGESEDQLHTQSVSDALSAFLLGGSVDLMMAALAEEAAKVACKV